MLNHTQAPAQGGVDQARGGQSIQQLPFMTVYLVWRGNGRRKDVKHFKAYRDAVLMLLRSDWNEQVC